MFGLAIFPLTQRTCTRRDTGSGVDWQNMNFWKTGNPFQKQTPRIYSCTMVYNYGQCCHNIVHNCTILFRVVEYGTILYTTVQYCTLLFRVVQYSTMLYNIVLYCLESYNMILIQCCTMMYNAEKSEQCSTMLYNVVQHCTICTIFKDVVQTTFTNTGVYNTQKTRTFNLPVLSAICL